MLPPGAIPPDQWACHDEHHPPSASCVVDDPCCKEDDCSLDCSSVCDGFVDCDDSTVCSESHCDEVACSSTGPVCFDKNCFSETQSVDQSIAEFLAQDATLTWDTTPFLPSAAEQSDHPPHSEAETQFLNRHVQEQISDNFAFSTPPRHINNHSSHHHPCHTLSRENVGLWSPAYSSQTDLTNVDMYDMIGAPSGFHDTHHGHAMQQQPSGSGFEKLPCFLGNGAPSCSDAGYQHLGCYLRNSGDNGLQQLSRAPPSRVHRHIHSHSHHRVSHYARHARRRSSHLLASPVETPPPLDSSSIFMSPSPGFGDDDEAHVCRWTLDRGRMKSVCGAFFPDANALQQHLVTAHIGPIDGMKGYGYYCRWEGCHRPDEPFSQKSKLQGHFLTHSNCMSLIRSVQNASI
jgi:hypothetical protein